MDWILIGIVSGSLVTSTFKDKEACMGRVATLHDQKIEAKCVEVPAGRLSIGPIGTIQPWCLHSDGTTSLCP